jgi:hypothetical protein
MSGRLEPESLEAESTYGSLQNAKTGWCEIPKSPLSAVFTDLKANKNHVTRNPPWSGTWFVT